MTGKNRYIQVILPIRLDWEPFYRCTDDELQPGDRVCVGFAGRRYIAVVSAVDVTPDLDASRIQPIHSVERRLERITEKELEFWHFISSYYLCTPGEVYHLAYSASRTAGEESQAHAEERKDQRRARLKEALTVKIAKLEERLEKKEIALKGKHNTKVTASLEEARDRISEELEASRRQLQLMSGEGNDEIAPAAAQEFPAQPAEDRCSPVMQAFAEGRTVLLSGGPSRMDMMMDAARSAIAQGKDVLLIVPELSLSKHLQDRLASIFGERLRIFHSGATAANRRETARLVRDAGSPASIILGTKAALFLPFTKLGLVMVEEEHDVWYKEQDRNPRINGRDCAIMLGAIHHADTLLSSPTPSLESILNCYAGRYAAVTLPSSGSLMELIDTSEEYKKRGMVGSISRLLARSIDETLSSGGNALVLRPWGPVDDLCEELRRLWPEAAMDGRVACFTTYDAKRMDLSPYQLLAVIQADVLLERQNFRADERAIQILEQLRGRLEGRMIIQTKQSSHQVFARDKDLIPHLLNERRTFGFPPYTRLVDVIIRDNNEARLEKLSMELQRGLQAFSPVGPYKPLAGRNPIEGMRHIRISLAKDASLKANKKKIADVISDFEKSRKYSGHISLDVDPA